MTDVNGRPEEITTDSVLKASNDRADWDLVRGAYAQCIEIADNSSVEVMHDSVTSHLASALGRVAATYRNDEEEYARHVFGTLGHVEKQEVLTPVLFRRLYSDERLMRFSPYRLAASGDRLRRRPTPLEAAVETARRMRDVTTIQEKLSRETSGILGGSCSYGRFFNVTGRRGRQEGSDLDLLVVMDKYDTIREMLKRLENVTGITGVPGAIERAEHFLAVGYADRPTVFSHRFGMWTEAPDPMMSWADDRFDYEVSLHFLSRDVLDWLLVSDAPKLVSARTSDVRSLRDYRDRAPGRDHDVQRSFSGRYLQVSTEIREVEHGFLRNSGVYSRRDAHYYPGMFQNLIFPLFDLRWDNVGILGPIEAFRQKMLDQLRFERSQRRYELVHLALAHTRAEFFSPYAVHQIEQSESGL